MAEASAATNGHSELDIGPEATGPSTEAEIDPEVKQLVFEWITETLHKAWRSQESERKKVIKQLMLKWHPDKNKDDPALSLAATQHIQSEIERIENGLPRPRPATTSAYRYTSYRSRAHEEDDFQKKYEDMYRSVSEEIRRKREEFQRQFDERAREAKLEQQQRAREREEQWKIFEEQRRERERAAKEERERQHQRVKEKREQYDREQKDRDEYLQNQRNKRAQRETQNGHGSMNGDARPRDPLHSKKREPNAQLTDEERIIGMLEQASHDLKAAENDMNLEEPAHEWACFKAHQAAEKAIKALQFHRIGLKSNSHELTSLAVSLRDPELLELTSRIQEIIGNTNKLYNLVLTEFTVIPHNDYSVELALEAMTNATDIIERVKALIG